MTNTSGRPDVFRLRLKISMSLDGLLAGPSQSIGHPLGIGGTPVHEGVFPLRVWHLTFRRS